MATDAKGRPRRCILTGGQVHEVTQAWALVAGGQPSPVMAGKGYESQAFGDRIEQGGAQAVLPPRSSRKSPRAYDVDLDNQRNPIERCVNKLKHVRRIATRDDRKALYFLAFLDLAAASVWS